MVFLVRYGDVHGFLRLGRALGEIELRAQVSQLVLGRVLCEILELKDLVKDLINLMLVCCSLRGRLVVTPSFHALLPLHKVRWEHQLGWACYISIFNNVIVVDASRAALSS